MSAVIRRFRSRPDRLLADHVGRARGELVELLERPELSSRSRERVAKVLAALDGETASSGRWSFVMLSPSQNALVVNHLAAHSRRRVLAMRLWAMCFEHLRSDTGEVLLSRSEFAQALGVLPRHVSEVVSELIELGAISARREGRGVRYFMNPNVGTHLSGVARDEAQRAVGPLKVIDGGGKPSERRARASAFERVVL